MTETSEFPPAPPRVPSGVAGLDAILGGGLFKGGVYIIVGQPGVGKTTFGNQVCFTHARGGGRAVYVTLLSETHGRMLAQMQSMTFFDRAAVGAGVFYVNGFSTLESEGLEGLLKLLRRSVRDRRAELMVLDGMVTASVLSRSNIDYKKFINELQTWAGVIGCTVVSLTSATDSTSEPEYTMVDGIFELGARQIALRWMRQLSVIKFRGSGYVEGAHPYVISNEGLVVYPRLEGSLSHWAGSRPAPSAPGPVRTIGLGKLDQLMGGGVTEGSITLLRGSAGAGKTSLGLEFLAAGAELGEPGLYFGFYESPGELLRKARGIGLPLDGHVQRDLVRLAWRPLAEHQLDALAYDVLGLVRAQRSKRLFIDGLAGFRDAAVHPERLPRFLPALAHELRAMGVTAVISDESGSRGLPPSEAPALSPVFDNIVLLRQIEVAGELQPVVSVCKTRFASHDRGTYRLEISERGLAIGARLWTGDAPATGRGAEE